MDKSASQLFKKLFTLGSSAFTQLRETAISPEKNKILKEWGISDTAEMIGRTAQTLRNLEESGKVSKARQVTKGRRKERIYNLKEINDLRDYLKTRPHKPREIEPAILGFVNFKGGAGKTTSAICAAQYFATKGYKVLFIDCDSQASATQMFGYVPDEDFEEKDTLLNILIGESDDINLTIKKTYWDSLDLIPANLGLYNAELIIPTQIANHVAKTGKQLPFYNRLNQSLSGINNDYDLIILDCPPSMGMISINAIFAANALVVEMPPAIVDFASTIQFFKMVSEVMERLPKKEYGFIRVLITKFNGRKNAREIQQLLKTFFGQYVMSNYMIESEAIAKGASNMQTLYEIDKFVGDRRTFERAIQYADQVNEEIEMLIQTMWQKMTQNAKEMNLRSNEVTEKEVVE